MPVSTGDLLLFDFRVLKIAGTIRPSGREKSTHIFREAIVMVDVVCQRFFAKPSHVQQRRYEAMRAVFVDGRSQREVAETFGYQYDSLRQMVSEFRQSCHAADESTESPFFETLRRDVERPRQTPIRIHRSPTDEH